MDHSNCNRELKKVVKERDARIVKLQNANVVQAETIDTLERNNASLQKAIDGLNKLLEVQAKSEKIWLQVLENQQKQQHHTCCGCKERNDFKSPKDAVVSTKVPTQEKFNNSNASQQHVEVTTGSTGRYNSGEHSEDSFETKKKSNATDQAPFQGKAAYSNSTQQKGSNGHHPSGGMPATKPMEKTVAVNRLRPATKAKIAFSLPSKEEMERKPIDPPKWKNKSYTKTAQYYAQQWEDSATALKTMKQQSKQSRRQSDTDTTVPRTSEIQLDANNKPKATDRRGSDDDDSYCEEYSKSESDYEIEEEKPIGFIPFEPRMDYTGATLPPEMQKSLDECMEIERIELERQEALKPKLTPRQIDLQRKKELERAAYPAFRHGFLPLSFIEQSRIELKALNEKMAREDEEEKAKQKFWDGAVDKSENW